MDHSTTSGRFGMRSTVEAGGRAPLEVVTNKYARRLVSKLWHLSTSLVRLPGLQMPAAPSREPAA
ncbi:hypothetical protein GCM10022244_19440 [Streptomyces gulbargensis]|uniref:Transposase n=1 Tax=Streptomyces gulbargensis TaxID=364901 RepID=A0ABP7LVW9_9ACTN